MSCLSEISDFSMDIMDGMDISDDEIDFSAFDDAFDDPMEELHELLNIEDAHRDISLVEPMAVESNSTLMNNNDQTVKFQDCFDTQREMLSSNYHITNDTQRTEEPEEITPDQQEVTTDPKDLDLQIQASMSKLVHSMHRSEMSRSMLGTQQSADKFGLGNYLKGYSSLASGIAQKRSQLNNYMSHVGNSSTF